MKKFGVKFIVFLLPFIAVLSIYLMMDPFKVIWNYDSFYEAKEIGGVVLNKDFVSTTNFENKYKEQQYNSFIFGNSRSIFYQVNDWKKYIAEDSKCYHFDASDESLYSLHKKVVFLKNKEVEITNALLILDYSTLVQALPKEGHIWNVSPQLVGNSNYVKFHSSFLEAFFNPLFMYAYLDYKVSNELKPYMKENWLIDGKAITYKATSNELKFEQLEEQILNGNYYTEERMKPFYLRGTVQLNHDICIGPLQKEMLGEIHEILNDNKANVKVVIGPAYDQKKISVEDFEFLTALFGINSIYDYSGINRFTEDYHNYYENAHYRPNVTNEILKEIYQGRVD